MIFYRVEQLDLMTEDGYWRAYPMLTEALSRRDPSERLVHTIRYDQTRLLLIWERTK